MSAKNPEGITIPSVFVSDIAGLMLAEDYVYPNSYYIMVNGDLPFNINTHLLLPFAIVVALCMLVMLIFMIVKCIKDRRRARRNRLPNRALKKIPTCKFSKGDPYETCAICLDDYQEGERLRVLPCAHAYHAVCIDPWLTQNRRVCPVCKRRVFAAGERRRTHTDSDSDSSTEPLLASDAHTQGGTFEEQRENPFVRAARFMSRLRGRDNQQQEVNREEDAQVAPTENSEEINEENNDVNANIRTPLITPSVRSEAERGRRHRRRRRSDTTHDAEARPRAHADAAAMRSADHSINTDSNEHGEIGVAAIPARPSFVSHVRL